MVETFGSEQQDEAEQEIDRFRQALGPFVVAAEATRMAMVFTNAVDADNAIIFANDSFLKLTGYERDEVIGQPFHFLMSEGADPGTLELIRGEFDGDSATVDIECRRKDGRQLWVAISANAVHDEQGTLVQHCTSFIDLSAHMERIRRERNALHAVYQHTPDFIAITEGPAHRFTFANAAYQQLTGDRGLLDEIMAEAMPELVGQGIITLLDAVYETGAPFVAASLPLKLLRQPGQDEELHLHFLNIIYQPVRAPNGQITGVFCEGHDVTEQKAASEQVLALQAELIHLSRVTAMGTMAATLAHELTQPLTAISNYTAMCSHLNEAEGTNTEAMADALKSISESAGMGAEIIRRLRNMTKRGESRRELFDLGRAVRESIELVQAGACAGISIEDRIPDGVMLEADRVQIQQVIMNLLRNACEAAIGFGGRVKISTVRSGGDVVVSVHDAGSGVSPNVAETLFSWSESSKADGMGLGLSICRTILEAHSGRIWLEEDKGEGTCFSFSLPTAFGSSPDENEATVRSPGPAGSAALHSLH